MKELKCASCGGAMVIDPSACRAVCHYCGNQYVLNREDTDFYTDFHKQMQHFLGGSQEEYDRKTAAEKCLRHNGFSLQFHYSKEIVLAARKNGF